MFNRGSVIPTKYPVLGTCSMCNLSSRELSWQDKLMPERAACFVGREGRWSHNGSALNDQHETASATACYYGSFTQTYSIFRLFN